MKIVIAAGALLALAGCISAAAIEAAAGQLQVHVDSHSPTDLSGSLRQDGRRRVNFHMHHDDDGRRSLSLARPNGDNLLAANWTSGEEGLDVSIFRVMGKNFNADLQGEQSNEAAKSEQETFNNFRSTDEFKMLPQMSQDLGVTHKVTGYENPAALAFHKLALNAEKLHRSLTPDAAQPSHRVKRCDLGLDPFSDCSSNTFSCESPSGTCDKALLDYTSPSSCDYRGTPLTSSDYANGCSGMCGPSCYHCWTYICGDCCSHPGCLQHDGECSSGYLNVDCATAKGVLWGTGDSQYSNNC